MTSNQTKRLRDFSVVVVAAAILYVQQLALSFIPNVQFSVLLLVLYSKTLGFKKTTLIILIHVILTNLISPMGPMIPTLIPAMFIAWMLIPVLISTLFKNVESPIILSIFGLFYGFIYGWIYIPFTVWFLGSPFLPYLIMDIPFEIVMAITNMMTIMWLYEPLKKALDHQLILHN